VNAGFKIIGTAREDATSSGFDFPSVSGEIALERSWRGDAEAESRGEGDFVFVLFFSREDIMYDSVAK